MPVLVLGATGTAGPPLLRSPRGRHTDPRGVVLSDVDDLVSPRVGLPSTIEDTTPAAARHTLVGRGTPTWDANGGEERYRLLRAEHPEFLTGDAPRTLRRDPIAVADHLDPTDHVATAPETTR